LSLDWRILEIESMSSITAVPYLFLNGRCHEAIEFYKLAIGAEVEMLLHFNQIPDPNQEAMIPPGFENKVMHASLKVGNSTIFLSDGNETVAEFKGFGIMLGSDSASELQSMFDRLAVGGEVIMPMSKTFWSDSFGMVNDKFGVSWMLGVNQSE